MIISRMDDSSIEAEIQRELDQITDIGIEESSTDHGSDDPGSLDMSQDGELSDGGSTEDALVPSMADYVTKIQTQSKQLELELMECDELMHHSDILSSRSVYHDDLLSLAQEEGMDVDALKRKVLQELEEEDEKESNLLLTNGFDTDQNEEIVADTGHLLTNVAENVVTDLLTQAQQSARGENTGSSMGFFVTTNAQIKEPGNSGTTDNNPEANNNLSNGHNDLIGGNNDLALSIVNNNSTHGTHGEQSSVDNNKAGLVPEMGVVAEMFDSDKLERELLQEVLEAEQRRKQLEEQRSKELFERKQQEDAHEKEFEEKRKMKQVEIKKEGDQLSVQKQQNDEALQKEALELKQQIEASLEEYEREINELAHQTAKEKEDWQKQLQEEKQRQDQKRQQSAVKIQALYRGYSVRKCHGAATQSALERVRTDRWEQRVAEIQILMDERDELKRVKDEEEALLKSEEERRKRLEEEEKQMKIDEEKRKKEEERVRKEEEKKRKQEEERMRKEEEKCKKEEEKRRKEEEKRQKQEEEKLRKEEEKRKKEEEKRKKEEEKRRKKEEEDERKRQAEEKERLEKIRKEKEEKEQKEQEEKLKLEEKEHFKNSNSFEGTKTDENEINKDSISKNKEEVFMSISNGDMEVSGQNLSPGVRGMTDLFIDTVSMANNIEPEVKHSNKSTPRKTPRPPSGQKTPRPPSAKKVEGTVYERPLSSKSRNGSANTDSLVIKSVDKNTMPLQNQVKIRPEDDTRKSIKLQHELAKSHDWGEYLPQAIDHKRLAWIKECKPLSKILSDQKGKKASVSKKPPRRPTSAKNLPDLDEGLVLAAANVQALKQVTTVQLHDLPGCTLKSLAQCVNLKSVCLDNCNLVTTQGLEGCPQLQYVKLNNNQLEVLTLKDLSQLVYLDVSHNALGSVHGLDGCAEVRYLDVSHNKITRIAGLDPLKKLHTLNLSHNQLITSRGLSEAPTIQSLDLSHNHLPTVDDIDKLALLQELCVSNNSLMQVPALTNQVLLSELVLSDNSISFLSALSQTWLPLLSTLTLNQNSISMLDPMLNLLLLENLDLRHNQVLDLDQILPGLLATRCLCCLSMEGNPVCEEKHYSDKVQNALPFLTQCDGSELQPKLTALHRTEFERLCLSQRGQVTQLKQGYLQAISKCSSLSYTIDIHVKFFSTSHQLATDIRYTHEYGISMVMPKEIDMNFDVAPTETLKSKEIIPQTILPQTQAENMKSKFDSAFKGGTGKQERNVALDMKNKFEQTLQNRNHAIQHAASPTPKAMFEQNLTKTISHANQAASSKPQSHSAQNSAADMKSKFDMALMGANKSGQQDNTEVNGHRVKSSKSLTTNIDAGTVKRLLQASQSGDLRDGAATKIQAYWRGYHLRKQLEIAYNYARCDDLDDDLENFAEVDLGEFDFNMDDFDRDLEVPDTPQIPKSHPVLGKPPSHPSTHKPPVVPHLFNKPPQPPDNPKHAWRNADSALSENSFSGRPPLPPLSRMSDNQSCDTQRTRKTERLADEWGFKDTKTAELMLARAKKLKYNAAKRKKLSLLDPKQRLALFRKLEETTRTPVVSNNRKHMPRKEYFQAREQEVRRQEVERHVETQHKSERTFEWVHTQVGSYDITSARIQKGSGMYGSEGNLPRMDPGVVAGGRTHLINSPVSMDLQSVESASTFAEPVIKPRKFSQQNSLGEKLPPIHSNSNSAPSMKPERMSFRNPKTEAEVGWGGGRKRNQIK